MFCFTNYTERQYEASITSWWTSWRKHPITHLFSQSGPMDSLVTGSEWCITIEYYSRTARAGRRSHVLLPQISFIYPSIKDERGRFVLLSVRSRGIRGIPATSNRINLHPSGIWVGCSHSVDTRQIKTRSGAFSHCPSRYSSSSPCHNIELRGVFILKMKKKQQMCDFF